MDNLTSDSDFWHCSGNQADTLSNSDSSEPIAVFSSFTTPLSSLKPKRRAGRVKFRETRHPVYRGIRLRKRGKWVCEVREPNKKSRIWLGTYPTPEMAARAHDVAALAMRGRSACLNFADSVWRLPTPVSSSPKDIQKTAAEAAEAFRPQFDAVVDDEPSAEAEQPVNLTLSPENIFYFDEEAVFGMHNLIDSMAEGLLLSPPNISFDVHCDDVESFVDLPLWSYTL